MRLVTCLTVALSLIALSAANEQQRILRRVIKSTPTASNLGRIRAVSVRSPAENGAVTEISSNEAAKFGERSANETSPAPANAQAAPTSAQQQPLGGTKTKTSISTSASTTTTSTSTSTSTAAPASANSTSSITTTSAPATTTTTTSASTTNKPKASDRQQSAPQANEVELLSSAPSSWQTMTAVEAPVAMLIATGTRAASASSSTNDLASSSSTLYSSEESASQTGDFLRSASSKGASHGATGETFSRLRQQHAISKQNQQHHQQQQQQQQQQAFFYPQQEQRAPSKVNQQASKTPWYQTTTAAPRPAPIVQEQQQHYEQQNEQYVEQQQQQQIEYNAAPLGMAEPFAFDFKTLDNSGNGQYRKEESDKNGVVRGSYGYTDANGIYRHVDYVADQNGFRANIKSNEPGLIGETQPASIQLAGGAAPANNQRQSALRNNADNGEWVSSSSSSNSNQGSSSADLALAPPEFESSHKSQERARLPRHFRN